MKTFITGGSGCIGTAAASRFLQKGFEVTATGSSPRHPSLSHKNFTYISADTAKKGPWQEAVGEARMVINLAGRNIFSPWTAEYRKKLYNSRILTTRNIVDALPENNRIMLLSTSACGFYGNREEEILTEKSGPGKGFLTEICIDWEKEALKAEAKGTRVAIMRFGTVLTKEGGALAKMIPLFKMYMGGPLGNGSQWFPWIHMEDLALAMEFLMEKSGGRGIFNFCAPEQTRNRDFTRALADVLGRPACFPAPSFLLRSVMGELGDALLSSQRVRPAHLDSLGFRFKYGCVEEALGNIIEKPRQVL